MPDRYTWEAVFDTRQAVRSIQQLPDALRRAFSNVRIDIIDQAAINGARNALRTVTNDFSSTQSQMTGAARDQSQQRVNVAQDEMNRTSQLARLFGRVRIQEEQNITATVQAEAEKRRRAQATENPNIESRLLGNLQSTLVGGVAGYFTVQGIRQITQTGLELAQMNTTVARSQVAFESMAGSAEKAQKILQAVRVASGGTVTEFQAIQIANQAQALGLAKTTGEFEKLTRAARAVTFVSPVIHDVQSAITELALASANLSFRRLDQLGLSVTEVRNRIAELKAENSGLDDSQAFLQASVDALNAKFGTLLDSTAAQAGGVEKLTVAWSNFMQVLAQGPLGEGADKAAGYAGGLIDKLTALLSGDYSKLGSTQGLQGVVDNLQAERGIRQQAGIKDDHSAEIAGLQALLDVQHAYDQAVKDGVIGLDQYAASLQQITGQAIVQREVTAAQAVQVDFLNGKLNDVVHALDAGTQAGQFYAQAVALVGSDTLQANEKTAQLVGKMVELTVQYNAGIVSGSEYTAAINTMGGQLVSLALNAANAAVEVANLTYQTQAFYAAQNSKLYFGSGGTKGTRPIGPMTMGQYGQLATDTSINPFTLQTQEKSYKTYQAQLDAEAKKAASAAKKATGAATKAFNQAQKEFESMISSIVKVSQVTQEDIEDTKLGIYKPKTDEYLRRLRDEVNNGVNHDDVSIEDAAAGLNKIGIDTVGKSKEAILKLFEQAFGNLSLFADEANLQFLNDTAVNEQIKLQELAKKGQENVFKHFGGVVESAVSAALGGVSYGGSAAGSGEAAAGVAPTISIDGAALAGGNLDITATITKLELADGVVASPVTVSATITAYVGDAKAEKPTPLVTGAIAKFELLASAPVPVVPVGATITAYGERTDAEKPTPTVSAGITVFLESSTAEKPTPTVSAGITAFLESSTADKPTPTVDAAVTRFLEASTAEKPTPTVEARLVFSSSRVDFAADEAELVNTRLSQQIKVRINLGDSDQGGFSLLPADAERISLGLSGAIAPKIDMGEVGRIFMTADSATATQTALGAAITPHITPIIDLPTPESLNQARTAIQSALSGATQAPAGPTPLGQIGTIGKQGGGGSSIAQQYVSDLVAQFSAPENIAQLMGIGTQARSTIDTGFLITTDSTVGSDFVVMMQRQIFTEGNIATLLATGASTFAFIIAGFRNAMNDKNNKVGQEFVNGMAAQVIEAQTKAVKEE